MSFRSGLIHQCSIYRAGVVGEDMVIESGDKLLYDSVPCRVYRKSTGNTVKKGANIVTASLNIQFLLSQDIQHNDKVEVTGTGARLYPGRYRCNEPYAPNNHHWEASLSKEEEAPRLI